MKTEIKNIAARIVLADRNKHKYETDKAKRSYPPEPGEQGLQFNSFTS